MFNGLISKLLVESTNIPRPLGLLMSYFLQKMSSEDFQEKNFRPIFLVCRLAMLYTVQINEGNGLICEMYWLLQPIYSLSDRRQAF